MLAQWYPPIIGGEEGHVQALSHELTERGHRVTVATLRQPGLAAEEDDGGVRVVRLDGWAQRVDWLFSQPDRRSAQPFPDPGAVLALRQLVDELRPDVVHAHNWLVHSYLPLDRRAGAPLVLSLHDYSLVCARKNLVRMGSRLCSGPGPRKCLRCAADHYGLAKGTATTAGLWASARAARRAVDAFLPVSSAVAEGNELVGSSLPWEVIPNFVRPAPTPAHDLSRWTDQLPAQPYLLFVGAFAAAKGVHVLLDAYARLRPDVPLVLIGYPTAEPMPTGAPPPGVRFLTDWPRAAVMEAWRRSLIGIIPSTWRDPCPTVAMEAMLAGRPVVASRIGGLPDLVDDGGSGLLVEPGNVDALAEALQRLVDDDDLRARLGRGAADRAPSFSASTVVPRIEGVYRRLCGMPPAPATSLAGAA